jgi:hypothetical protein
VHKAILDGYYAVGADPLVYHEQLAEYDIAMVEAHGKPWEKDDIYGEIVLSRNCVMLYMDWLERTGADHGTTTLAVEEQIETPILDGRVILRGKTDRRLSKDDSGHQVIEDLKTNGRNLSQVMTELEKSYQGYVYRAIRMALDPDVHIAASRYRIINKVKNPKPGVEYVTEFSVPGMLRSTPNILRQIEGICSEMLTVIDRVGTLHPDQIMYTTPGEHCAWCAYRNPCLISNGDPVAGAEMLDQLFAPGRHRRYDSRGSAATPSLCCWRAPYCW